MSFEIQNYHVQWLLRRRLIFTRIYIITSSLEGPRATYPNRRSNKKSGLAPFTEGRGFFPQCSFLHQSPSWPLISMYVRHHSDYTASSLDIIASYFACPSCYRGRYEAELCRGLQAVLERARLLHAGAEMYVFVFWKCANL